jgi:hypothetical protein
LVHDGWDLRREETSGGRKRYRVKEKIVRLSQLNVSMGRKVPVCWQ